MKYKEFYGYDIYENGKVIGRNGREMSISKSNGKRAEVKLTIARGVRKSFTVARLVYCVFNNIDIFELDKDMCVTYIDGDVNNTHIDNLKLIHRRDLIQGGKHRNRAVLTKEDVKKIRKLYSSNDKVDGYINQYNKNKDYYSYRKLGKMFNVNHTHIKQIIDGVIWNKENYVL